MAKTADQLRAHLVDDLCQKGVIGSEAVAEAFAAIPRERFIPDVLSAEGLEAVYRDQAHVTKKDARGMPLSSSSQPSLMARMLELLELRPGQRVLEIGTGTGYNAALLAHLVGPRGRVTSVDVDAGLARRARRALRESGFRVSVSVADARQGRASSTPYDRIIVTASADQIPRNWLDQLKEGGLLELPLRLDPDSAAIQLIPVFHRRGDRLRSTGLTWGSFMPLHGGDGGWQPPPASLNAGRSSAGKHSSLGSLAGPGLSSLSEAAARELLASVLSDRQRPRATGFLHWSAADPPLLLIYLLLAIPANKRLAIHSDGTLGVGLIHRRSRSLAFVSVRTPWTEGPEWKNTRFRWRLDAYGGDHAAAELERLLQSWRAMRRADRQVLRIAAVGAGETLRLRFAWTRP
jgi:protein-L-isoaspartate(D-aspartate) O-methyltransferase